MTISQYRAFKIVFGTQYECRNDDLRFAILYFEGLNDFLEYLQSMGVVNGRITPEQVYLLSDCNPDNFQHYGTYDFAALEPWADAICAVDVHLAIMALKPDDSNARPIELSDLGEVAATPQSQPDGLPGSKKKKKKKKKTRAEAAVPHAVRSCAQGAVTAVLAAARAADAARDVAELTRKHEELLRQSRAEEKAKEDARRARAEQEREARARDGPQPFSITQRPLTKERVVGRARTAEEQRQHEFHVDPTEKAVRAIAFDEKQRDAHADRIWRRAEERRAARRAIEKNASAAHEAAVHSVPPRPRLADAVRWE